MPLGAAFRTIIAAGEEGGGGPGGNYAYYTAISVKNAAVGANETNFPVALVLTDSRFATTGNGGRIQNTALGGASGALTVPADFVVCTDFNDPDGTKLDFEIVAYDATTGALEIWVEIASLSSSSDTTIYFVYGDSEVTTSQENVAGTWGNGFEAVYHFAEDIGEAVVTFGAFASVEYPGSALSRLEAAVTAYNSANVDFAIGLGDWLGNTGADFTDAADAISKLQDIEAAYDDLSMDRYYGFGNHDLDWLTKAQFKANTGKSSDYEKFVVNGIVFYILDPMHDSGGNDVEACRVSPGGDCSAFGYIDATQLAWLQGELDGDTRPAIIFCEHDFFSIGSPLANASTVRGVLENYGNVKAVFSANIGTGLYVINNGITYVMLRAMDLASSNSYAIVAVYANGAIGIEGAGEQLSAPVNMLDSTGNGHRFYGHGVGAVGKIGRGVDFDGSSQAYNNGRIFAADSPITVSIWTDPDAVDSTRYIHLGHDADAAAIPGYDVSIASTKLRFGVNADRVLSASNMTTSSQFWAVTWDTNLTSNDTLFYLNGSLDATRTINQTLAAADIDFTAIGARTTANLNPYDGILDELHIASVVRDADWIATAYANQNDPTPDSTFWSALGTEQEL